MNCKGYYQIKAATPYKLRYHNDLQPSSYDFISIPGYKSTNPKLDIERCIEAHIEDSGKDYFVLYVTNPDECGICVLTDQPILNEDFHKKDTLDDLFS